MSTPQVITIDGPAASGKTTVGYQLAQRLDYLFLDTGCMYRAVTWAVLENKIDVTDQTAVVALAKGLDLAITAPPAERTDVQYLVFVAGQDVTEALRSPAVDQNVSAVASIGGVRDEMVARQRQIGMQGDVVMVGRDIGTVVMPDAPLKLYITASAEERARRRLIDREGQGISANYSDILADINRRDKIDSSRDHSPLRPAEDAILIDTTKLAKGDVISTVMGYFESS